MIRISILFSFLLLSLTAIAQRNVSGKVTGADGSELIGVTVQNISGTSGAVTDFEGKYTVSARSGDVLRFSYTGYAAQEVTLADQSVLDVVLLEDINLLEQVVVIGYGAQKKKELTSAVTIVDEKAIRSRPMVSAAEALQGKAAGVQVVQPSGKPGGDLAVRVRGATSVLAGNEPLYVVDGVPTTDIRGLNPADIESMSVLKDASSAAIYGARAANGVVLITTRRGKSGESVITLNMYGGVQRLRKPLETLTTKQYRNLINEIMPGVLDPAATAYTDWQAEVFGTGVIQSYQLGYSGGTDKARHLVSFNYLNNKGIVSPSQFDRYSARMNLDNQLRSWLKIGTNINVLHSRTKDTPDNASSGRGGVIMSALNTPPFQHIYKEDGSGQFEPNPFQPSWENPIAYMQGPDQLATDTRLFGNISAEATVFQGFTLKSNIGIDHNNHIWDWYLDPFRTNYGRVQNGAGRADKSTYATWLWENTANYVKNIGENHHLGLLAGSSIQKNQWNGSYVEGSDYPSDTKVTALTAANIINAWPDRNEWAIASFFGRATYDFQSKYLFTASVRRDGSSKLAHHWGTMPAFSAGWRLSSESFFPQWKGLDDLKIRAGWGKNGNQDGLDNYAQYGRINYYRRTPTNPLSGPASYQATYNNPDLRWETTAQTNVGLDLSMWNGRMVFTADAYLKKTSDVLLNVQLPASLPITSIQTNAGAIENRGLDLNLSTVNLTGVLRWSSDFNISFNRNKVTDLQFTDVYYFGRIYSNNQDVVILKEGLPLGSFFGYVSEGVNPETGDLTFKDVNENGIFDPGDRTVIGNPQPDFVFGFTNTLNWRRWDLNIFLQGSYGNDIYNATRIDLEGMFDSKNQSVAVLNRWTPDNRNTDMPRAVGNGNVNNVRNSTRFVEDGSYLRLKSFTLSYNFDSKKMRNISRCQLYLTGQNLLTFTQYSGFDPEVNAFGRSATELGIDYGTYPHARTLTIGANLDF